MCPEGELQRTRQLKKVENVVRPTKSSRVFVSIMVLEFRVILSAPITEINISHNLNLCIYHQ